MYKRAYSLDFGKRKVKVRKGEIGPDAKCEQIDLKEFLTCFVNSEDINNFLKIKRLENVPMSHSAIMRQSMFSRCGVMVERNTVLTRFSFENERSPLQLVTSIVKKF